MMTCDKDDNDNNDENNNMTMLLKMTTTTTISPSLPPSLMLPLNTSSMQACVGKQKKEDSRQWYAFGEPVCREAFRLLIGLTRKRLQRYITAINNGQVMVPADMRKLGKPG